MRKFTLLLVLMAITINVNAKNKVTTLWEDTYTTNIEIPVANLVEGATITVYTTVTASDKADDRKLRIFYNLPNYNQATFSDISDWVERSAGSESYSFTITSAAMTTLNDNTASTGILFIGANNSSYITITKITMTEILSPTSTGSNLLDADWATSTDDWEEKIFAAQAGAKIGDIIKINVTCSAGWAYAQINVKNTDDSSLNNTSSYSISYETETDDVFEYEITNLADLKKIQANGFKVEINKCKITSIALVTYADSYGYITFTIGDTGYATWSSDKKYDFASAGLTAYYASSVSAGTVTLTSMDITWDWQGYIIKGTEGEYDVLESLTTDGTYYPGTNYLKAQVGEGNVKASTTGKYHYIFAKKTEGDANIGFYKLTADHTLGAKKAYLETSDDVAPAGARVALIFDDGTITGITDLKHAVNDGIFYNMNGMRVERPAKGLFIRNGKKFIVK